MNDVPPITASLSRRGKIIVGMTAECGCCHFQREVSFAELADFLESIEFHTEAAAHAKRSPLTWCGQEGSA